MYSLAAILNAAQCNLTIPLFAKCFHGDFFLFSSVECLLPTWYLPMLTSAMGEEHPNTQLHTHGSEHWEHLAATAIRNFKGMLRGFASLRLLSSLLWVLSRAYFALDLLTQKTLSPRGLKDAREVLEMVFGINFLLPA